MSKLAPSPAMKAKFAHGLALHKEGRLVEAQAVYDDILRKQPTHFDALHLSGVLATQQNNYQRAVYLIEKAISVYARNAASFSHLGNALTKLGRVESALACYDKAIRLTPSFADAHYNRGILLQTIRRNDDALLSYNRAIELDPGCAGAFSNRGILLHQDCHYEQALASFDRAISLRENYAEALSNRGATLKSLGRLDEAIASLDMAIRINPEFADAHNNRANTLQELKRFDEAVASYRRALELKPGFAFSPGMYLYCRQSACDWANLDQDIDALLSRIEHGEPVSAGFPLVAITDSAAVQLAATRTWVNTLHPAIDTLGPMPRRVNAGKIRIGYFSSDFYNHATSYLMAGVFESHDRSRFEVVAFSYGPDAKDAMQQRLSTTFDVLVDIRHQSDMAVAKLSRDMDIDIAIDLKGYTGNCRPSIFAHRAAPVQVNYLGFPGSLAVDYFDYILADRILIPEHSRGLFSEKVVYLPNCYQANDSKRAISESIVTRSEAGLPESGFVFCCFNANFKISPRIFDIWMRLLRNIDGSVLWLFEGNPSAVRNLRMEAQKRDVDGGRLVFANPLPLAEHLGRHRLADLFLDTLPCNAHTTASDALWAGLPVLTCTGESFASRVAASLLHAVGLPELATNSLAHYESLAFELATQPGRLLEIKARLQRNRLSTPLFDSRLFAEGLEAALSGMHARAQRGMPPESF